IARLLTRNRWAGGQLQDDIFVLVEERSAVKPETTIEKVGLEADFIGRDGFRIERPQLGAWRRGHVARGIAIAGRRAEERPWVHAAALEAGRNRRIGKELIRETVVRRHAPVEPVALESVRNSEQAGKQAIG